jgi:NADPH:quinone reductase-like Zn-dependent oxidoreductase
MGSVDEVIRRQTVLDPKRLDPAPGEPKMLAVVTTGNGGPDKLAYREVRRPRPRNGEVLVRVLAAGVNNTEINTRLGWYSAAVEEATGRDAEAQGTRAVQRADGGWDAPTPFPFIQGTDCCGRVADVGPGGDDDLLGRRVLVRPCMRPSGFSSLDNVWMGSDFDGAFAQYVCVPASEVFPVESALSDVELGAIPCAYGTAENMLRRAGVHSGQHVLVTGASGGVGSAAVQLARLRGAEVTAVAGAGKAEQVRELGAARVVDRDAAPADVVGEQSVDAVVDNVSGPGLDALLATLRRGGRYVSSGAIAGPVVSFDKRIVYLRDLSLIGCTAWDEPVFPALIAFLEEGGLRPPVAATWPLERIAEAQAAFLEKRHVGKYVLVPPAAET